MSLLMQWPDTLPQPGPAYTPISQWNVSLGMSSRPLEVTPWGKSGQAWACCAGRNSTTAANQEAQDKWAVVQSVQETGCESCHNDGHLYICTRTSTGRRGGPGCQDFFTLDEHKQLLKNILFQSRGEFEGSGETCSHDNPSITSCQLLPSS